ncbi:MAG: aldo/keto reductase [Nitrospiraceae bacterium]|nr:aldo/keto reductase [Nitrospiraceae bacterium]
MRYTRLGSTGLMVSKLCLGTMTFGLQVDEATSIRILDAAHEHGIDFLDLADVYPLGGSLETVGRTEEIVGRWLRGRRSEFIIASKCSGRMGPKAFHEGNSRKHIMDAVEGSLKRLGTDYIDLYQLHRYDPETPIEETMSALDDLVRQGKVRYIGASNFLAWQLARAQGVAAANGLERFATVQPRYNLLFREFERELFPLCATDAIGVIPYNPLAGGMLTGKHDPTSDPTPGTRFTLGTAQGIYQKRYWHGSAFEAVADIGRVASDAGLKTATLALAWVLHNPAVTAPIIGASAPEQLADTVAALDVQLEPEVLSLLEELTHHFRYGDAER